MPTRPVLSSVLAGVLVSGCAAGSQEPAGTDVGAAPSPSAAADPVAPPSSSPSSAPSPEVRTVSVTWSGGEVGGTQGREEVALDEQVVLRFVSDVDEEIHVHGYDVEAVLPAGATVDVPLTADIPGVFEVELHDSGKVLYQLRVS